MTSRRGLEDGGELAGRVLLGLLFVLEGLGKLGAYDAAAGYMAVFGMPPLLLPAAIVVELGAGLLVIIGWHTRIAAVALAAFCTVAAVVFHTRFGDHSQLIHFEKDMALAGAFLILSARGAGRVSLDAWRAGRRQ
ncbi:DoxX family protein [Inquilinus limosus]|uniref:DoxX family protein n=1 Tax=Inquilinus limosus TaxID=171674 RepID=UPI0005548F7D|nr:DoxX family protein [Inquilinus limosus]